MLDFVAGDERRFESSTREASRSIRWSGPRPATELPCAGEGLFQRIAQSPGVVIALDDRVARPVVLVLGADQFLDRAVALLRQRSSCAFCASARSSSER